MVINDPVSGPTGLLLAAVSGEGMSPVLRPVSLSPEADFTPRWVFACDFLIYFVTFFYVLSSTSLASEK